ncbi:MAG: apolipoprotein N-acyltransferase [Gammaproteobacteria bacterium]|nr:apolipoprotein N-acyltransferase [Gammaproteobacteria bacterium]
MRLPHFIEALRKEQRLALPAAFALGGLLVLAFAPFHLFPLAVILPLALLWLIDGQSPRVAAWRGFAFGFGLFGIGMHWLYISLHVYGKAPVILAVFLMICLVALMAAYYAGFAWLLNRYWPAAPGPAGVNWRRYLLAAPALWVLLEYMRGWFLSGFPWFSLGYSQLDTWLAGFAPVGGVFMVSLFVMMLGGALLLCISSGLKFRAAAAAIMMAILSASYWLQAVQWTHPTGNAIKVALVQGNIPQDKKWLPEYRQRTIDTYLDLTRDVLHDADLVIWPEAAIPLLYSQLDDTLFMHIEDEMLAPEQRLVTGVLVHDRERGVYYNSAVVIGGAERRFYHKRHLVPFGEYFPVPDSVREWLRLMNLPYSDFEAGEGDNRLELWPGVSAAMLICYEAVFGSEAMDAMPEAGFVINISNDGWFGESIGPKQHFQITRMRAKEAARPLVRVTNTGISGLLAFDGGKLLSMPVSETAAAMASIEPRTGGSPYGSHGNLVVWATCLLLAFSMPKRKDASA